MPTARTLRLVLAGLVLVGGIVHLQQFLAGFSSIPIIGPMFLANALASGAVAALLIWRRESLWVVAGAAVAAGSLVAFLISRGPGLFGYVSTTFEAPEILAVTVETAAVMVAALILIGNPRPATVSESG